MASNLTVSTGLCPDESCQTRLYCITALGYDVECSACGQTHTYDQLEDADAIVASDKRMPRAIKNYLETRTSSLPKKNSDLIKVHGLSNYQCKLLSPLLTRMIMNKEGKAVPVEEPGHGNTLDCGRLLSTLAFSISPKHLHITGFGRDKTGSERYLADLLDIIRCTHDAEERLIPIHADGDGHCLVHALSRAITGREIFWHALRVNLVDHLRNNLDRYRSLLKDFIYEGDWTVILNEANPHPSSDDDGVSYLGNIHIFALSNVLKRPIILLDSLEGIKNVADYTAIFVPALVEPEECRRHLPLCIAWSGSGHNHFVPLVGVANRPLPTIPEALLPNVWVIDKQQAGPYLNFNADGSLTVGGGKTFSKGYLFRLMKTMEDVFLQEYGVSVDLVSDMHLYVFGHNFVSVQPDEVIKQTVECFKKGMILRCLTCKGINTCEKARDLPAGGIHSAVVKNCSGERAPVPIFIFEDDAGSYLRKEDKERVLSNIRWVCVWCASTQLRDIDKSGNILYEDGDPTKTLAQTPTDCCGKKHFWNGKEYDKMPRQFVLKIPLHGVTIEERVTWFYDDYVLENNSSREIIAAAITEKYFARDHTEFSEVQQKVQSALLSVLVHLDDTPQKDCAQDSVIDRDIQKYLLNLIDSAVGNQCLIDDDDKELLSLVYGNEKLNLIDDNKKLNLIDDNQNLDLIDDNQNLDLIDDNQNKLVDFSDINRSNLPDCALDIADRLPPLSLTNVPIGDIPSVKLVERQSRDVKKNSSVLSEISAFTNISPRNPKKPTVEHLRMDDDKIKLCFSTSDGRQKTVEVDRNVDFAGLQNVVQTHFFVKPIRQVLKTGILLDVICNKGEDVSLNLRPGDHVFVEIQSIIKEMTMPMPSLVKATEAVIEKWNKMSTPQPMRQRSQSSQNTSEITGKVVPKQLKAAAKALEELLCGLVRKQPRLSTVDASLAATSNMAKTSAVPDGSFTATFITAKTALVQHPHVFNLTYSDELLRALGLEPESELSVGASLKQYFQSMLQYDKENTVPESKFGDSIGERGEAEGTQDQGAAPVEAIAVQDSEDTATRINEMSADDAIFKILKRQNGDSEKSTGKIPKLSPTFTIVGSQPTVISPAEAEKRRQELSKILCSKKAKSETPEERKNSEV